MEVIYFPFFLIWSLATLYFLIHNEKGAGASVLVKLVGLVILSFYAWIYRESLDQSWQLYQQAGFASLQQALSVLWNFLPAFLAVYWCLLLLRYVYAPSFLLIARQLYALIILTGLYWLLAFLWISPENPLPFLLLPKNFLLEFFHRAMDVVTVSDVWGLFVAGRMSVFPF